MSDVKQCDICGDTYETPGWANNAAKVSIPLRYKVWEVLPHNRDKVGWVQKDICPECNDRLIKLLSELD